MSPSYYYTVASLPTLQFGAEPPLDEEHFFALCNNTLTDPGRSFLLSLRATPPTRGVGAAYVAWERSLRNDLARLRGQKMSRDALPYLREGEEVAGTGILAREIAEIPSPREAERRIDWERWSFLEDRKSGSCYFDEDVLVLYYLQLRLLHREASFKRRQGVLEYEALRDGMVRSVREGERE